MRNEGTALFDTVAAISTPFGKGGVALLRVSGGEAIEISAKVFKPISGESFENIASRRAVYGNIVNLSGDIIDDGIAVIYRAPASFTGEDTVEISCHGGVLVTSRVFESLLLAGARRALAGEFTRRSFINGKMSLCEAEALGDLLDAENEEQLNLSRGGYNGLLGDKIERSYDGMREVLSNMEASIDFPEEDLTDMPHEEIESRVIEMISELEHLADTYRTGHAISEGIPTVICGKPNVGKSALYNYLVGRDAAIVTDVAGTTRDVLTETVTLGRVTLRLCDTAGIHVTSDKVEGIGIDRARTEVSRAELILALIDGSRAPDADDDELVKYLSGLDTPVIWLITKSDIVSEASEDTNAINALLPCDAACISISSLTGVGCDKLADIVNKMYIDERIRTGEDAVVFNARQNVAIQTSITHLRTALDVLSAGLPYDICSESIREAMSSLGEISGKQVREDVISEIFSKFCVGK